MVITDRVRHFPCWKRALITLIGVLAIGRGNARAAETPIDPQLARTYFQEATKICAGDAGRLWGISLCGPMLFVAPATREVIANQADSEAGLTLNGDVFAGHLPASINVANTAVDWAGVRWTMIIWPLPADKGLRDQVMMHELFHRIQDKIGLPASDPSSAHLNTLEGRIWLELEWRALARALATDGRNRRSAVADAIIFSVYRRNLFPDAASHERALEMNEGLAEYTGVQLRGTSQAETIQYLIERAKSAETQQSFMRSFAYVSGPMEGMLLDLAGADWRKGLTAQDDLEALLAKAYGIRLPESVQTAAQQRSKEYGGDELRAGEIAREKEREKILAQYRSQLVDGPVLVIPLRKMNVQFNPNNLLALGELGTVYPTMRITDEWGILEVSAGALMTPDWKQVTVAAPSDLSAHPLRGSGWTLQLAQGWRLIRGPRPGDFSLQKEGQ